jgi:hypothetical protein
MVSWTLFWKKGQCMRCLVLSDIHSNLEAFEAVLEDAGSVDQIWCLGDVVGGASLVTTIGPHWASWISVTSIPMLATPICGTGNN